MNSGTATLVELLARAAYKRWRTGELNSDARLESPAQSSDERMPVADETSYNQQGPEPAGVLLECASTPMPDTAQNGKQKLP
jgi:hypothetical protein